jgi:hypothetical protein
MEVRVGERYRLGRKIGSGSFGDIYLGWFSSFNVYSVELFGSILFLFFFLQIHIYI